MYEVRIWYRNNPVPNRYPDEKFNSDAKVSIDPSRTYIIHRNDGTMLMVPFDVVLKIEVSDA